MLTSRKIKLYVGTEGVDRPIERLLGNIEHLQASFLTADYILYPFLVREEMGIQNTISKVSRAYQRSNKRVIIISLSDFEGTYTYFRNIILLRTSAKASKLAKNEFIMPYTWDGMEEPFLSLPDERITSIGFCGLVSAPRIKIIAAFEQQNFLKCDFTRRDAFWGGKPHDPQIMADFWNNLQQNHFALAPRGAGNFSMRFYQALSIGRIPVLVNTDMKLPFSNLIPWKEFIVFEKDEKRCVERVLEICAEGRVMELQQRCYQVFHQYLSPKAFLGYFLDQLTTPTTKKFWLFR